jgi:hypothetical protein
VINLFVVFIQVGSEASVVSWVDTSLETYDKITLMYNGQPYFYNAVQIRRDKLRDGWQFTNDQIRALYNIAKTDSFNTVAMPLWWNEVQPDQMYTPVEVLNINGNGEVINNGNTLVLQHADSPHLQKRAKLKYDFSALEGAVSAAMIRVYVQNLSNGPGIIEVYGLGNTAVLLDAVEVNNVHFFDLDVTAFVQQATKWDVVSFELRASSSSSAVITLDRMSEATAGGLNYVDYTSYLASITPSGVRYPPTLRISRNNVYDWNPLEQMIHDVENTGLKLEILWFGSDTTNLSMDNRLPYYVIRNYQKALDAHGNLITRKQNASSWRLDGVHQYYMDKLDPYLREKEKTVIQAVFDHIAAYNAANGDKKTVVGCQVNNETNIWTRRFGYSDRYHSVYADDRWEFGGYTNVYQFMMDIRAEWLSYLSRGVKESGYSVWTRQNNAEYFENRADTVPENELLRKTVGTHLDFLGMDFYRHSELDKIYRYLGVQYSQGKNFPMIMETDWTMTGESQGSPNRIPDYGILLAYAANGAHNLYDLIGPDGHNFYIKGPNNTAIPGDTVAGANYDWNTQTRRMNQMLQKIGYDLASRRAGGGSLVFFNPFAEESANVFKRLSGYQIEYNTNNRGVGIAIRRGENEFVLASKKASIFKLPAELQVQSAAVGHYNHLNLWVRENNKPFSQLGGKYILEMNDYEVVKIEADPLPANTEPLSYYQFEQNILDSAGVNHGTAVGSELDYVNHALDEQGYALNCRGSSYISLPVRTAYPRAGSGNGLNEFTYSMWVKRAPYTGTKYIIGNYNDGTNTCMQIDIRDTGATEIYLREDGGASLTLRSPEGLISVDKWHLLAFTYDGLNLGIYIDGILRSSSSGVLTKFSAWQYPMVLLGRNVRGRVDGIFEGWLDDLKIYNYAFTSQEIVMQWYQDTGKKICMYGPPTYDMNGDCKVDLNDFLLFASYWLDSGLFPKN